MLEANESAPVESAANVAVDALVDAVHGVESAFSAANVLKQAEEFAGFAEARTGPMRRQLVEAASGAASDARWAWGFLPKPDPDRADPYYPPLDPSVRSQLYSDMEMLWKVIVPQPQSGMDFGDDPAHFVGARGAAERSAAEIEELLPLAEQINLREHREKLYGEGGPFSKEQVGEAGLSLLPSVLDVEELMNAGSQAEAEELIAQAREEFLRWKLEGRTLTDRERAQREEVDARTREILRVGK